VDPWAVPQIDFLEEFPHRCGIAPDSQFIGEELRHLIYKSHRIIFRIEERYGIVRVLHVRHAARRAWGERPAEEDE
jgi:plasmid stabilization system protein ParE